MINAIHYCVPTSTRPETYVETLSPHSMRAFPVRILKAASRAVSVPWHTMLLRSSSIRLLTKKLFAKVTKKIKSACSENFVHTLIQEPNYEFCYSIRCHLTTIFSCLSSRQKTARLLSHTIHMCVFIVMGLKTSVVKLPLNLTRTSSVNL